MCPPPCRGRRSFREYLPPIKTRISKREVNKIIVDGEYECFYLDSTSQGMNTYEGCLNNLLNILHDSTTTVKVAGRRNEFFIEGVHTVLMSAPIFPATFIFRKKIEEE